MKKAAFRVSTIMVAMALCLVGSNVFALESMLKNEGGIIAPNYVAIVICANNLKLNSSGRLTCMGETSVQAGYLAGITKVSNISIM